MISRLLLLVAGMSVAVSAHAAEPGFVDIFNGKDFSGWEGAISNGLWTITADGSLKCEQKGWKTKPMNLWTNREYTNFVVRFEFKLSPKANNGLGIRSPGRDYITSVGMEVQMLDDDSTDYFHKTRPLKPYQYHGSIYGVLAARKRPDGRSFLRSIDEWNEQEITADGGRVRVVLNGETIVDADVWELGKNKLQADGTEHPGLLNKSGRLVWCGHNSPVWIRNVRVKELP